MKSHDKRLRIYGTSNPKVSHTNDPHTKVCQGLEPDFSGTLVSRSMDYFEIMNKYLDDDGR
jgi:hypothetical protein